RSAAGPLAESRPLLRDRRSTDEADPGGSRASKGRVQARRARGADLARRHARLARTAHRSRRAGRGALPNGGDGRAAEPRRRASLLRRAHGRGDGGSARHLRADGPPGVDAREGLVVPADLRRSGAKVTPERWEAVKRLFNDALERSPNQRAAYVAEAAKSDPALAEEVGAWLSGQGRADEAFGTLTRTGGLKTLAEGTRLGPYQIVALVGAGG